MVTVDRKISWLLWEAERAGAQRPSLALWDGSSKSCMDGKM